MKRVIWGLVFCIAAMGYSAPRAAAQDHGQVGAFADYFRLGDTDTGFAGVGGRVAINANRYIGIEAEMNYDFNQVFNESFTAPGTGSVAVVHSDIRLLHGLFGPAFSTGHGPIRFFVTAKGGFINFRFNPAPATFSTFASSATALRTNDVSAVFYPGGGIEGHIGPIGLRADVGDEIYFANGGHSNLRVTFGPIIRF